MLDKQSNSSLPEHQPVDNAVCETNDDGHHRFQPAGILMQARKHVITQAMMQRPSIVLVCPCGAIAHAWVPSPPEDEETIAPPGGILKPLDGKP